MSSQASRSRSGNQGWAAGPRQSWPEISIAASRKAPRSMPSVAEHALIDCHAAPALPLIIASAAASCHTTVAILDQPW